MITCSYNQPLLRSLHVHEIGNKSPLRNAEADSSDSSGSLCADAGVPQATRASDWFALPSLGVNGEETGYNVCGGAGDASISNELPLHRKTLFAPVRE